MAEIEALRDQFLWKGAEIIMLEGESELELLLKKSDAFVIISPTEFFSETEVELIEEFVNRGGRLLVIADPTRSITEYATEREESVIIANEILAPYRISIKNDYVYNLAENEGNFRNVIINSPENNFLTRNISEIVFYAAHSLSASTEPLLTGSENTLSSLDDAAFEISLAATDTSQNVLVMGDMTFMVTPYNQVLDNFQLILNIADFLYGGTREKRLDDFPYLFKRDIGLIFHGDIDLDENLIKKVADLKSLYAPDDISLSILEEPIDGFDCIHLGIYPPGEDLEAYTEKFGIQFKLSDGTAMPLLTPTLINETTDGDGLEQEDTNGESPADEEENHVGNFFRIPGFGNVPDSGFGYFLLDSREGSIHLILLADSQENAINLLSLFSGGSLSGCLIHENIAVCEQDAQAEGMPSPQPDILEEPLMEEAIEGQILTPTAIPTETPIPTSVPSPE